MIIFYHAFALIGDGSFFECHEWINYIWERSDCFKLILVYLWFRMVPLPVTYISSASKFDGELNWQQFLGTCMLLQLKTSHQCDCEKLRFFFVIVIKVSWFFLHVGLTNIGLVILAAMPVNVFVLLLLKMLFLLCTCAHTEFGYFQVQKKSSLPFSACALRLLFFFVAYRSTFQWYSWILEQRTKTLFHSKNWLSKMLSLCVQDGTDVESWYFFAETMVRSWGNFDDVIVVYWLQWL